MRKIQLAILFLGNTSLVLAQAPAKFNYQAVIRDASGTPKVDQEIIILIEILDVSNVEGWPIYTETHVVTTNNNTVVNLQIGKGTNKIGTLSDIN